MKYGFILLIVSIFVLCGCSKTVITYETFVVDKIFMNSPNSFTFWTKNDDNSVTQRFIGENYINVKIKLDVKKGNKSYVFYHTESTWSNDYYTVVIHMSDMNEMDGAGWNHGKFGRGQTTVLQ